MFRPRTTIVIGAGASLDFGFPLGADFKKAIARRLAVRTGDFDELRSTRENQYLYQSVASKLKCSDRQILYFGDQVSGGVAFSSSIDNYLRVRRDSPEIIACVKAAIVEEINGFERAATQLIEPHEARWARPDQFDGTWHQIFAEIFFLRA